MPCLLPTLFTHLYLWLIVTSTQFSDHNKLGMAPIKKIPKHAIYNGYTPAIQNMPIAHRTDTSIHNNKTEIVNKFMLYI